MCNKINKDTPANSGEAENVASLSQPNASRYSVGDCILLDNGEAGRLVALGTEANGEAFAQVVMFESTPNKKEVLELEGQLPICCPLSQVLSKVSIVKARSAQAAHKLLSETTELIGSNWLFCSGFKSRSGAIMPYSSCELDLNTSEDDDEEEHLASDENEDEHPASAKRPATGRVCVECGATQTPQWREGPAGPKTLCNACGVRFNRLRAKGGGSDISIRKYKAAAGAAAAKKKSNLSAVPSRPRSKKTTHTMIQAPRTSFAPIKMEEDVNLPHSSTSSQDHDMLDLSLGHDLSILAPCPMRGVLRGATLKAFGFLSNVSSPQAASAVAGGGPSSHFELCTSPSNVNAMHSNQGGISKILSEELAEALSNIERLEASGKLQLPDSALERIKDVTEQVNAATNEADAAEEALRSVTLALMQRQRAAEEAREKASAAVDRLRGFMSTLINEHRIVSTPLTATKGVIQVPSLDYYGAVGAGSAPAAPMAASAHAACLNEAVSEARDPDLLLSCWSGFGRSNALPSVQLDQDLLMFDGFGPFGGAADGSGATLLLDDGSFGQVINAQA